jgi:CelD/BcsL family acetyltransferase involved in cellulose biosynthesis
MIQKLSVPTGPASATAPASRAVPFVETWNRLWDRSGDAIPLTRHECLGHLAAQTSQRLTWLTAGPADNPVAGIALLPGRHRQWIPVLRAANHDWLQGGNLLIDQQRLTSQHLRQLAGRIRDLPVPLVILDWAPETAALQQLIGELKAAKCDVLRVPQFSTGLVQLEGSWDEYLASRSRGFQKKLRSGLRKLQQQGNVQLERCLDFDTAESLQHCMDEALRLEHLGWKGRQGMSLNSNPDIRRTYHRLLQELAAADMLEIHFLRVAGQRIAFDIGFRSHGTWYSHKIGYDPAWAGYGPGQLLMYLQLQQWFAEGEIRCIDTIAEMTEATAKWTTEVQPRYRYLIATRTWTRALSSLSRHLRRRFKRPDV